jgi:hypothetical protein
VAAWSEALDRLSEAGLTRRAAETPLEFAGRAGAHQLGLADPVRRLAALVNAAAYRPATRCGAEAERGAGAAAGVEAWAAVDRVVRALDAHDPGWVRWRRRLDPRPLVGRSL